MLLSIASHISRKLRRMPRDPEFRTACYGKKPFSPARFVHGDVIHTAFSEVSDGRMAAWLCGKPQPLASTNSTFSSFAWYKVSEWVADMS